MNQRLWYALAAALLPLGGLLSAPAADVVETKSALETDAKGWTDLTPGKDLSGWKRVSIPPGSKLKEKNPWSVDAERKVLVCDGVGVHEMLLYDKELTDGVFHVEWSFKKLDDANARYNSGVYARNSADGAVWHQAQVGANVGQIFGDTLVDGQKKRINVKDAKVPNRARGPGDWNVYEITAKGKTVTLWINGAVTATWDACEVPKGYVGVEAEGFVIEFKNIKFKELK